VYRSLFANNHVDIWEQVGLGRMRMCQVCSRAQRRTCRCPECERGWCVRGVEAVNAGEDKNARRRCARCQPAGVGKVATVQELRVPLHSLVGKQASVWRVTNGNNSQGTDIAYWMRALLLA